MKTDPEHILQSNTNPSSQPAYIGPEHEENKVNKPVETPKQASEINKKGSPSLSALEEASI